MERRLLLQTATGLTGWLLLRPVQAQSSSSQLQDAVRAWANGTSIQTGRVQLDIAPLVDNGNTVPLSVRVDSPMTASDHVVDLAVFNERNPQADVLRCQLGPRAGKAQVSTRIRLATTQKLTAVARLSDGSCWEQTVNVIVALAACLEELE